MRHGRFVRGASCYVSCMYRQDFVVGAHILTGLVCYMTTKILIYYFLVEKAVSQARLGKRNYAHKISISCAEAGIHA
jgi:hypothetical protein